MKRIETEFKTYSELGEDAHVVFFSGKDEDDKKIFDCCICSSEENDQFMPISIEKDEKTGDTHIVVRSLKRHPLEQELAEKKLRKLPKQ